MKTDFDRQWTKPKEPQMMCATWSGQPICITYAKQNSVNIKRCNVTMNATMQTHNVQMTTVTMHHAGVTTDGFAWLLGHWIDGAMLLAHRDLEH